MKTTIPDGFIPLEREAGYGGQFGQIYGKPDSGQLVLGFAVMEHHLNPLNTCHGGAIATFADYQIEAVQQVINLEVSTPTISLSVDYLSPALLGDWLECTVKLQKQTGRMIFTSAEISTDRTLIARSTAIYHISRSRK